MKKLTALGGNLIVRADISEKKSAGGIIYAAATTREAQAPEEVTIISLGDDAFNDLDGVKPKVGDLVAIAKYEGKTLDTVIEGDKTFEYRVIADTRILAIIEKETKEEVLNV